MSTRVQGRWDLTPAQRFAAQTKLDPDTGCIEWQGGLVSGGYAQFQVEKRSVYVHRWSWEQANGPVPEGLYLDHLCRNRRCCNPEHLEPVTFRENVLRGQGPSAANAIKTHCPKGHAYTEDNTYVNPRGSRVCRTCKQARARRDRDVPLRRWVGERS